MPPKKETRARRVENEFALLNSLNRVVPRLQREMDVYKRFVVKKRVGKSRYDALVSTKKADLLGMVDFINQALDKIPAYSCLRRPLKEKTGRIYEAIQKEDLRQIVKQKHPDSWKPYEGMLEKMNRVWFLKNREDLKKVIGQRVSLPNDVMLMPLHSSSATNKESIGVLMDFVFNVVDDVNIPAKNRRTLEKLKNKMMQEAHKKYRENKQLIFIAPEQEPDNPSKGRVFESPELPKAYALSKRWRAYDYLKVVTDHFRDIHTIEKKCKEIKQKQRKEREKHGFHYAPGSIERTLIHEKEHAKPKQREFLEGIDGAIEKACTRPEELEWQKLLMDSFHESFSFHEQHKDWLESSRYLAPHFSFEHNLGFLLAKAYAQAKISRDEVNGLLETAAKRGDVSGAANEIAERVKGKNPVLGECIHVMTGKKEPELHTFFRESMAKAKQKKK
ncbi:MAG: hypothetical protein KAW41_05750 [Candidatus Diapherotrites archaeon]|nr:hypothetical protein [Candidatus Diapherotrites archaeon]